MPIAPDGKDWTWVIERPCPARHFDAADVAARADDAAWSPLEYGCHVRDVHLVYAGRVRRMLAEADPR